LPAVVCLAITFTARICRKRQSKKLKACRIFITQCYIV
jgi:hypothetical protein